MRRESSQWCQRQRWALDKAGSEPTYRRGMPALAPANARNSRRTAGWLLGLQCGAFTKTRLVALLVPRTAGPAVTR